MDNYLRRSIGIFYYNREWVDDIKDKIIKSIPENAIKKIWSGGFTRIELNDGSTIIFAPANDNSKGMALSEVYIQKAIPLEIYQTLIRPLLKIAPRAATIVEDIKDFRFGQSADSYYRNMMTVQNPNK